MTISDFNRFARTATVAAAVLAGCGTPQSTGSLPDTVPQRGSHFRVPPPGTSWMSSGARREDLLYVADPSQGFIRVLSLNRRALVGLLYQDNEPNGMCTDKASDVFVPGFNGGHVVEYAHGLKKPKAKLTPAATRSMSCSVDPSTGNLAVTTFEADSGSAGNVAIYQQAQGAPTTYSDPAIFEYFFCGYDGNGNLFVDGLGPSGGGGGFVFAELPKGSRAFTNITLNQTITQPGQVQWDGQYVAIGDQTTTSIYRFAIAGSAGTLEGTTKLNGATTVNDFTIHAPDVIAANAYTTHSIAYTEALFYHYPAGGRIRKVAGSAKYTMEGLAVSLSTR